MQTDNDIRFRPARLCVFVLGCALATAVSAANSSFEAGVTASQRGDYQQAVEHFNNARDEGLDTPALHHNLGVAYYKLGRYESARQAFKRAAESPKMRAMSFYNLGLVAQKEGDDASARDWFEKAHETARTRKLRRLAAVQLGLTDRVVPPYKAYLEGFAGHDSNPRLADEEAIQQDDEGDAVFGALAVGERLLGGDWDRGASVIGVGYADFHPDLDDQDIAAFAGGFRLHHSPGQWRHQYELTINRIRLGDDTLQTGIRAGLRSQRRLSRHLVAELRLRGEDIDGDGRFDYLSGNRYEARTRLIGRHGRGGWKLYYRFEHNDRDDLEFIDDTGEQFFSVSPARHEIGGSVKRPLAGDFSGELGVAFRRSDYRDPEVRDGVEQEEREDDRLEVKLGVSHPLGRWTGRIETVYWDNSSECGDGACDRFEYDRLETLVSIGRSF